MPTKFTLAEAAIEEGTKAFEVSFTDEDGNPVSPTTAIWSLTKDDKTTIVNDRTDIAITTPGTTETILLSGADLALEAGELYGWRYLVIEGTYNSSLGSDLPFKDHLFFAIRDIAAIPGSLAATPGPWFARVADIEAFLQVSITTAEEVASAERGLGEATAAIRNYCRQFISYVEDDPVTLDAPRGAKLFLPELPVESVSEVIEDGTTLVVNTDYRLGANGILRRLKGNVWKRSGDTEGWQNIDITYTHGYSPIPDDIVTVCTRAAARAFQAGLRAAGDDGVTGVSQKSLGDFSVGYTSESVAEGTMGASAARMLLLSEKDLLDKFRV